MTVTPDRIRLFATAEQVDPLFWEALARLSPERVASRCGATWRESGYELDLLGQPFRLEPTPRKVAGPGGRAATFQEALVLLVYLASSGPGGLAGQRVPLHRLLGGEMFFTKQHAPATDDLAARLGLDRAGFGLVGRRLGAKETGQGEASWLLYALPQAPLELIFHQGDEDFPPGLTLLIDAAATTYLTLDAIFALVNLLAGRIKEALK